VSSVEGQTYFNGGKNGYTGFEELPARIALDGKEKISFELQWPAISGADYTPSSGAFYLVMVLRGFHIQNGAGLIQ
jgi:hypothetical protein